MQNPIKKIVENRYPPKIDKKTALRYDKTSKKVRVSLFAEGEHVLRNIFLQIAHETMNPKSMHNAAKWPRIDAERSKMAPD